MVAHVDDPLCAGRHGLWCVRELVDGPFWFWVTISRYPMNFEDAKKFLAFARRSGQTDDDFRPKTRDWFVMVPISDDTASADTGDSVLERYETLMALGEDLMAKDGDGFIVMRDGNPDFITNHGGDPWMCYWCVDGCWDLLKYIRPEDVEGILRRPRMSKVEASVYHTRHQAHDGPKMRRSWQKEKARDPVTKSG